MRSVRVGDAEVLLANAGGTIVCACHGSAFDLETGDVRIARPGS